MRFYQQMALFQPVINGTNLIIIFPKFLLLYFKVLVVT